MHAIVFIQNDNGSWFRLARLRMEDVAARVATFRPHVRCMVTEIYPHELGGR